MMNEALIWATQWQMVKYHSSSVWETNLNRWVAECSSHKFSLDLGNNYKSMRITYIHVLFFFLKKVLLQ